MHAKRIAAVAALAALAIVIGLWAPGPQIPAAVRAADPPRTERQGAWLDSLVFSEQGSASAAIDQLQADELDVYAQSVSGGTLLQRVLEDPDLTCTEAFGGYNELTFNPAGPEFYDGRLNPFSNAHIREAMNRLIDRDYLAQELFDGMAVPMFTSLLPNLSVDYIRYQSTVEAIEAQYAYDLAQAHDAINAQMLAMGAYLQDGTWHYNGAPVTVVFIIRVEDVRRDIGDYVADQLEAVGFTVDRQYKTRAQASPIWNQSDPWEGRWHIYTGGWIATNVSRDDATNFGYFYTPLGSGSPLWQNYDPTPAYLDVATQLWNSAFSNMAERDALFTQALPMAMDDAGAAPPEGSGSLRVWLANSAGIYPRRAETVVASDRGGGIPGAQMFPYVARFEGTEGGDMRIAQPGLLVEPWNPIAGSNWLYDIFPIRATQDYGAIVDPNTGLTWAQRITSAACVVKEGLPVGKTLDWIALSFAPTVTVPDNAWADWDATTQTFIEASDMPTPTLEANAKCTVTYPADLFGTVTWHDGSPLDASDFVMRMIMAFDMGKPESAIYDEALAPQVNAFLSHFRGVTIDSLDPLVITTYDDAWYLDAESMVLPWWPNYSQGPSAWHNLAPAIRAEAAGELAFSTDKAGQLGVEWTNYVGGASLPILESWMDQSTAEHYIPYQPTMGAYVTQAEADARWAALQVWYAAHGHFWLGTGPFYVEQVSLDPKALTLGHFDAFVDVAGRWDAFAAPAQPQVVINHANGAPGSYFNVTGTGFPPDDTAFVVVNNTLLGSVTVDPSGGVAFTLSTLEADPGLYHVRVSVNPSAGVAFTLDEALPVQPREGDFPLVIVPDGLITHYLYMPLLMRNYDPALLYFDDFSDPNSGWSTGQWEWGSLGYQDGEYEVNLYDVGGATIGAPINSLPGGFSSEADMRLLSGATPAYGLMLHTDQDTEYNFKIHPVEQEYMLWYWDGSQWNLLAGGPSGAINPGNAHNHLKIEWTGDELAVYVNGQFLASVSTAAYGSASQGIVFHDGPAIARYDNYEVRSLSGGAGAPVVQPRKGEVKILRAEEMPPLR